MINCVAALPIGAVERLAKVLCETFNGPGSAMQLYDGLFEMPYERIHEAYVDGQTYYFDNVIAKDNGDPQPQVYGFRFWCYRVEGLVHAFINEGIHLREAKNQPEETAQRGLANNGIE